jgi:hypothetical protein
VYGYSGGVSRSSEEKSAGEGAERAGVEGELWVASVENTTGSMPSQSESGSSSWAADMLRILEFPQAPPGCVRPHDILLHIPSEGKQDGSGGDDLFDDDLDSAYGSWRRMANPAFLLTAGWARDDEEAVTSLGDVRQIKRRVNLGRYSTGSAADADAMMPLLYKTIVANFSRGYDNDDDDASATGACASGGDVGGTGKEK